MTSWQIAPALPAEVEDAEDAYNAYARQAEDAPHLWGEEQNQHLEVLAARIRSLYVQYNISEDDQIVGL